MGAGGSNNTSKWVNREVSEAQRERMARTLFVANLPFSATKMEIRELLIAWAPTGDELLSIVEAKDKLTGKCLGYAHAEFQTAATAQRVAKASDWTELRGRVVRVLPARLKGEGEDDGWQELPKNIGDELKELLRRNPALKNISALRDAYERKAPGEPRRKLDVTIYGFKNFSTALRSVPGIELVKHSEKGLTYVARLTEAELRMRRPRWRKIMEATLEAKPSWCAMM